MTKEVNMVVMTELKKDYVSSNLRYQLMTLQNVLDNLENSQNSQYESDYTNQCISKVESELKKLRNFLKNYNYDFFKYK